MAKEKILIVDDEEDILELVRFNLKKEGYKTMLATTGEQALDIAGNNQVDLIILDLMLPGIDGLEVTRIIRNDPEIQTVPIVMLTAKGDESDIITGLELGANDYMSKPFSPKELIARIRSIFRRRHKLRMIIPLFQQIIKYSKFAQHNRSKNNFAYLFVNLKYFHLWLYCLITLVLCFA